MDRTGVLLAQYQQCRSDLSNFDSLLWQVPVVSYALNAVVIGTIVSQGTRGWGSVIGAFGLLIFALPLTTALIKNRLFAKARLAYAAKLLSELRESVPADLDDIPTRTDKALEVIASEKERPVEGFGDWLERLGDTAADRFRAYRVLLGALIISHLGQVLLVIFVFARTA